jgi:ATP-binding cassette subfamily F protein uup
MLYLKVTNLTKSYTEKPLVDHVDFAISKGQKVALVAKNWAGKSTLLNLLAGKIDRTDGDIDWRKGIKVWLLSQQNLLHPDLTVLDELFATEHTSAKIIKEYEQLLLDPQADADRLHEVITQMEEHKAREYESKIQIIISKLNLTELLTQKTSTLSWWEAKRVALAKTLVDEPDFLLLDEPTNHLDLQMIEWLEYYLNQQEITLFMVTHDRYFLERVCSDIFELDRGKVHCYTGNYSYFLEKKAIREENEKIETYKLKQLLRKELAWIRKAPRARATKQQFRQDRFYEIEDKYDTQKEILQQESIGLEIEIQERKLGSKILKIKKLTKSFGDKKIVEQFSHEFRHGERVGILGKNGVGKSTFLNMLIGLQEPDAGIIEAGEKVVFWYYQQKDIVFAPDKKVIDVIRDVGEFMLVGKGEKLSASMLLERFLFPKRMQHTIANVLSGGEKRRLYLLSILMHNPNFLILDEPTNDLDLVTLGILEDFLLSYQGCLIVVSHDRFFMDKIVDHLFVFEWNGFVRDFRGTYTEYKEQESAMFKKEKKEKIRKESEWSEEEEDTKKKLSYNEKRELDQLIKDIEKYEARKEYINQSFNNTDLPFDEIKKLSAELGEILRQLEIKEARWFELIERA